MRASWRSTEGTTAIQVARLTSGAEDGARRRRCGAGRCARAIEGDRAGAAAPARATIALAVQAALPPATACGRRSGHAVANARSHREGDGAGAVIHHEAGVAWCWAAGRWRARAAGGRAAAGIRSSAQADRDRARFFYAEHCCRRHQAPSAAVCQAGATIASMPVELF